MTTAKRASFKLFRAKRARKGNALSGASKWLRYWQWWESRAPSFCCTSVLSTSGCAGEQDQANWLGGRLADRSASRESTSGVRDLPGELRPHLAITRISQRKIRTGAHPSRMDYYTVDFSSREQSPGRLQGFVKNLPCKATFFLACLEDRWTVVGRTYMTSWFLEVVGQFF